VLSSFLSLVMNQHGEDVKLYKSLLIKINKRNRKIRKPPNDASIYLNKFILEIKLIIEAYLNAAIHQSKMVDDVDKIAKSFTLDDFKRVMILTIARIT